MKSELRNTSNKQCSLKNSCLKVLMAPVTATILLQCSLGPSSRLSDEHALIAAYVSRLQSGTRSVLDSPSRLDEEHRLIARYAARLAAEAGNVVSNETGPSLGTSELLTSPL
uniref:Uncharacterized protein n=1 Tax=Sphaerodactylus townsendi TaxID=933632 RepID=A0ACB8G943_9SAUR